MEIGDTEAVSELADTITLSALAQADDAAELAEAVWRAGGRAVGWGSTPRAQARQGAGADGLAGGTRGNAHKCGGCSGREVSPPRYSVRRCPQTDTRNRSRSTRSDRGIPGAYEGETVTRRRFMVVGANTAGGIATLAFVLPALGLGLGAVFKSKPARWETVGTVDQFNEFNYVPVVLTLEPNLGEAGKTTVYVRKYNPAIDTDRFERGKQFIAISDRCAHLGCPVRWVDAAERFICPCHGGVYDLLGRPVGGPPVRPLDRFYTRVIGDQVQLGPRFSVDKELRPFSPRDPGEPLDGIGQYLYPSRPGAQKL